MRTNLSFAFPKIKQSFLRKAAHVSSPHKVHCFPLGLCAGVLRIFLNMVLIAHKKAIFPVGRRFPLSFVSQFPLYVFLCFSAAHTVFLLSRFVSLKYFPSLWSFPGRQIFSNRQPDIFLQKKRTNPPSFYWFLMLPAVRVAGFAPRCLSSILPLPAPALPLPQRPPLPPGPVSSDARPACCGR